MNHLDRSHKENPKQNESKLRRPYDVSSRAFRQLLLPQPQALQHTCLYYALKLSTPGEELGFSFGIWRWKTEYWSILADQVLTTIKVLVPSFFLWYSICLQLYTEPRVVAVPI